MGPIGAPRPPRVSHCDKSRSDRQPPPPLDQSKNASDYGERAPNPDWVDVSAQNAEAHGCARPILPENDATVAAPETAAGSGTYGCPVPGAGLVALIATLVLREPEGELPRPDGNLLGARPAA